MLSRETTSYESGLALVIYLHGMLGLNSVTFLILPSRITLMR